ncbi:hypothetical protein [Synechococcus sp. TAK9802]|uniref:hypothetical protein n=1 Tax=Synechococcus sp. TAK9802 TaxID=1442558 RepID=UPI0016496B9F|nr:hypothetical protein [Synechococcus sp. TAK9802]
MLARCLSASLQGLEARPVVVEVDLRPALGSARSATAAGTALRQGGGSGAEAAQPNASCSVLVHPRTN